MLWTGGRLQYGYVVRLLETLQQDHGEAGLGCTFAFPVLPLRILNEVFQHLQFPLAEGVGIQLGGPCDACAGIDFS